MKVTVQIATCSDRALHWIVIALIEKAQDFEYPEDTATNFVSMLGANIKPVLVVHIIEDHIHTLIKREGVWTAECYVDHEHPYRFCYEGKGPTATIAALRAFAHSRLGPTASVPEEFVK